jgi:hypothetical protein
MPFCFVDLILLWGSSAVFFSNNHQVRTILYSEKPYREQEKRKRARKTNKAIKKQEQDGKPKPENKEPQTVQLTC